MSFRPLRRGRRTESGFAALGVALAYAAMAALWILVSDRALTWFFRDPQDIALASILKGWLFVGVTTLLLYALLARGDSQTEHVSLPGLRSNLPLVLIALLIVATASFAVWRAFEVRQRQEIERLQTTVGVKVQQLRDWLTERTGDAEFAQGSRDFAESFRRWQDAGDAVAGQRLMGGLLGLLDAHGFIAATILDKDGRALWASPGAPPDVAPMLHAALQSATRSHRVERAGPYLGANGRVYLDFVAPLVSVAGIGYAVLHVDPAIRLYPMLQAWHVPTSSGETVMFRREGDDLVFLNALRHRPDAAVRTRVPATESRLLPARDAGGDDETGTPVFGSDYRRIASLGVVRAVPGTDWFLVAKLDQDEVFGTSYAEAIWIGLTAMLALLVAGVGMIVLRQRVRLAAADDIQRAQSERLRVMQLLNVIASSSSDAIFAKDTQGRYLLFNREAERVSGKTAAEILGNDDRAIFPPDDVAEIAANDRRVMDENATLTFEEELMTPRGQLTFLATKGPLHDSAGVVIGMFGIARDITARKHAETALRDSEARFRTLFENAAVSITIHDIDSGRFVDANRHALDAFGCRGLDELLAGDFSLESPDAPVDAAEVIRRAVLEGRHQVEWKISDRFGRVLWEQVLLNRIVLDGIPRVIAIGIDITASKAADEAMRRQTEELKTYAAELERFNRATVGRELDMIELKRQVNELSRLLGRAAPYDVAFADAPSGDAGART